MSPETAQESPVPVTPVMPETVMSSENPNGSSGMIPKILIIVVVLLVLAGVGVIVYTQKFSSPKVVQTVPVNSLMPVSQPEITPAITTIESDTQTLDNSLSSLDTELSQVDAGLNDKQGDLSE